MLKAIIYKEWLKIRWAFFAMLAISLLVSLNIFLKVSHDMKFMEPTSYWYRVIFYGSEFYSQFMYVPLLAGLVIAITQFVPEMSESRLKLTLHLPLNENNVLMQMVTVGTLGLVTIYLISIAALSIISGAFFPSDVLSSMINTVLPWFLAGLTAYLAVAMIVVEPTWLTRIFQILVVYGFLNLLFKNYWYEIYVKSLPLFVVLCAFFSASILLSGNRFRKGVM